MAIEVRVPTPLRRHTEVRLLGGLQTPLEEGDTVSVLPAGAGG